jgi:hypothetical protein
VCVYLLILPFNFKQERLLNKNKAQELFLTPTIPTFKNANSYHFIRGEKGEDFISKKGF